MDVSIIIPVWNGAEVISECLTALQRALEQAAPIAQAETLCVDNGSQDTSAQLIQQQFATVRLLPQPANLGFAGGVNLGLRAAQGDILVLLNQDCMVEPDWLVKLLHGLTQRPHLSIAGCTILNADGSLNHTGAVLQRPTLYGRHLTAENQATASVEVEYVTGAAFALRRTAWEKIGEFDEGFYPAYYEETDYCFRARQHGLRIGVIAEARLRHLFTNRQWQQDPTRHAANQHQMRYRFAVKHLQTADIATFFAGEIADCAQESYLHQTIARSIAAGNTLRQLPTTIERRRLDRLSLLEPTHMRQLEAGFANLLRVAQTQTRRLSGELALHAASLAGLSLAPNSPPLPTIRPDLLQQELHLLETIYRHSPLADQPPANRLHHWRHVAWQLLGIITGRDYLLQRRLSYLHVLHLRSLETYIAQMEERLALLEELRR